MCCSRWLFYQEAQHVHHWGHVLPAPLPPSSHPLGAPQKWKNWRKAPSRYEYNDFQILHLLSFEALPDDDFGLLIREMMTVTVRWPSGS